MKYHKNIFFDYLFSKDKNNNLSLRIDAGCGLLNKVLKVQQCDPEFGTPNAFGVLVGTSARALKYMSPAGRWRMKGFY